MKKMYPAVVNSPKTELIELITETQTEITVMDASVLLAGEGIATIGNGETAETIIYTSVDGNVLKGCVRGYQGVARAWTAGTRVARNFTADDWDSARENILEISGRMDNSKRAAISLQPGISVVSAEQDAAFRLAGLQGHTEVNYQSQIGIFGVLNPYVIRYGENLLPPFYEWNYPSTAAKYSPNAPYKLVFSGNGTSAVSLGVRLPVLPSTTYTIQVDSGGVGQIGLNAFKADGTSLDATAGAPFGQFTHADEITFTTPANTAVIQVLLYRASDVPEPVTFKNPMLNFGSSAIPFVPREDAMLALQTELHANPDTGANPDMVFERDGQYFRLAKWKRLVVDGNLEWAVVANTSGFKQLTMGLYSLPITGYTGLTTKYDGKVLPSFSGAATSADLATISQSTGLYHISISNTDTGWGDAYTPTADEIKAYFMGWIMCDANTAQLFTGAAGQTKCWAPIANPRNRIGSLGWANYVLSLPTTMAPVSGGYEYHPYQLLYQLATPTVEPIPSEGQLTFFEGENQVEVGTGIVLRESVKPTTVGLNYLINHVDAPAGWLRYKTNRILTVYKNNQLTDAVKVSNSASGQGGAFAYITPAQFDPSAAYSVTYLMLDKYPAANFDGTYAENEKALLLDAVKSIQENTTRISVLESKKAEKDNPVWIAPTLLNNWINYGGTEDGAGYRKDSDGYVHLRGVVKLGVAGAMVFKLPSGYRPKSFLRFPISGAAKFGEMTISPEGGIYFDAGIDGTYVSMLIPPFAAEQ
ncbi:hypothetical protein D3C75_448030 [compost metagenome]